MPRFAIITPYHNEGRGLLERCIESVRHQSVAADHFLVCDGHAQDWLDHVGVRHLRLGLAHRDFGNTPRGIGALLAAAEGYVGIGFLDADNWFERDHVEQCCAAADVTIEPPIDVVVAKRRFVLPDGTITNLPDAANHVDTSCFWLLPGAFHLIHHWLMAPEVASICDRVFYRVIKKHALRIGYTQSVTVNYVGNYEPIYRAVGREPPPDAKSALSRRPVVDWIRRLNARQLQLANARCGLDLLTLAKELDDSAPLGRNDPCHCGSGRKYKHCHGAW